MSEVVSRAHSGGSAMDDFVTSLQKLRTEAGAPSYAEIARRIAERRRGSGVPDAAARLSKSTVFDVFQLGRRRLNAALLMEIVRALGVDEHEAAGWGQRCVRAQQRVELVSAPTAAKEPSAPDDAPSPPESVRRLRLVPPLVVVRFVAACVLLNLFGGWLVMVVRLPLFLDMVGTAIASVVLGPWTGVLVALMTNGGETLYDGSASLPFVVVNVAGALIWGYGVRRFAMGRTLPRYLMLNALVGIACTLVAVPILVMNFHGETRNASSGITQHLLVTYHSMEAAVFSSNILISLLDKFLSGFGALIAASLVPVVLAARLPETWRLSLPRACFVAGPIAG